MERVGSLLSYSGLFLQEPTEHQLSVPYRNPHVLSWDDDLDSSYLSGPFLADKIALTDQVNAILNDESFPSPSLQIEQGPRIKTTLHR